MTLQEFYVKNGSKFPFEVIMNFNPRYTFNIIGFENEKEYLFDCQSGTIAGFHSVNEEWLKSLKKEIKLEVGKKYKDRRGNTVEILRSVPKEEIKIKTWGNSEKVYGKCIEGKYKFTWYYDINGIWSREDRNVEDPHDIVEEIIEEKDMKPTKLKTGILYTLEEITLNNTHFPIKVVRYKLENENFEKWGIKKDHKAGEVVEIKESYSGNVYFTDGGYVGIKSTVGNQKAWTITEDPVGTILQGPKGPEKEIVVAPEIKAKLEEKSEEYKAMMIENNIRVALFSRTLRKVEQKDVEKVIDICYNTKKETLTQKQLTNLINKAVDKMYESQEA